MKVKLKEIFTYIIVCISMILLFAIGMIISYSLPNNRIRNNIKESMEYMEYTYQNNNPIFGKYITAMQLDPFSDILILNTAVNKGKSEEESAIIRAFENSKYSEGNNQPVSIKKILNNDELYNNEEYSRYWHGIQTVLRPLLVVFNYEEIRVLFMVIMFILLGISVVYIYKNIGILHAFAFLITMTLIGFFIISISLQYIGIFAITLISIILINVLYKKKKEYLYPYLFIIIGGCASFFDLLTVPLVTLGTPLEIIMLLRNKNNKEFKLKESLFEILKMSIIWSISYAATFVAKWIIASIVLHRDAITVAINQILFRVNGNEEYPATSLGAININLSFLNNKVYIFVMMIIIVTWILAIIKYRKKVKDLKVIITLLVLTLYPYFWYMVFAGHSTIHAWFTYRLQAISIFGLLCIIIETIDIRKIIRIKRICDTDSKEQEITNNVNNKIL